MKSILFVIVVTLVLKQMFCLYRDHLCTPPHLLGSYCICMRYSVACWMTSGKQSSSKKPIDGGSCIIERRVWAPRTHESYADAWLTTKSMRIYDIYLWYTYQTDMGDSLIQRRCEVPKSIDSFPTSKRLRKCSTKSKCCTNSWHLNSIQFKSKIVSEDQRRSHNRI